MQTAELLEPLQGRCAASGCSASASGAELMSLDWFAGLPGELTQTASATSSRHAWAARRSWLFDQPKTIVKT